MKWTLHKDSSGRNIKIDEKKDEIVSAPLIRKSTLSDMMGNAGVMNKH